MKRLLLFAGASVITLLMGEIAARFFRLAPEVTPLEITEIHQSYGKFIASDNPILKYVPKPNAGDINADGLRDRSYPVQKKENVFRIQVLGDSIGFGFCNDLESLPMAATFPKVLEEALNRRHFPRYEKIDVMNLSVSGYDTEQEVEFLKEKGLIFSPDLVVVAYCLNDAWDASAELGAFKRYPGWSRLLFLKSDLFRMVYLRGNVLKTRLEEIQEAVIREDRVARALRKLKRLSRDHHFETLIVVFPLFENYKTYSRGKEHQGIRNKAEENGFHFLDLFPIYRHASGGDEKVLQGRCNREHPNEAGHRLAATAIEEYLVNHGMLDNI